MTFLTPRLHSNEVIERVRLEKAVLKHNCTPNTDRSKFRTKIIRPPRTVNKTQTRDIAAQNVLRQLSDAVADVLVKYAKVERKPIMAPNQKPDA
jgi:hypothetical protein